MKKFRLDFNLDAWIQNVEVEAENEQDALSKLSSMTVEDFIREGYVHSWDFSDCDVDLIESEYRIKVFDIVSFIEEDQPTVPDTIVINVTWREGDDLEDLILSELEWKLDIPISTFDYTIVQKENNAD